MRWEKKERREENPFSQSLGERNIDEARGDERRHPQSFPFLKISLILPYCVYGKLDGGEISQCEKDN